MFTAPWGISVIWTETATVKYFYVAHSSLAQAWLQRRNK